MRPEQQRIGRIWRFGKKSNCYKPGFRSCQAVVDKFVCICRHQTGVRAIWNTLQSRWTAYYFVGEKAVSCVFNNDDTHGRCILVFTKIGLASIAAVGNARLRLGTCTAVLYIYTSSYKQRVKNITYRTRIEQLLKIMVEFNTMQRGQMTAVMHATA